MYPVSDALKRRVLGSHERRARVTVLDTSLNPVPGGQVSGDTVTNGKVYTTSGSGARRTAEVSINNADGIYTPSSPGDLFYWNRLIRIEQGIIIQPGVEDSAEWVPMGVFMIDRPSVKIDKGGITLLTVRARDRWKILDKAEYEEPGTYSEGSSVQATLRAAAEEAGVPSTQIIEGGTARTLGVDRHFEEGDRIGEFMTSLANSFALRCYFDVNGYLIIEDQPALSSLTVAHHYRPGVDSIVTSMSRELTDERFANHIVVSSATSDPEAPPPVRAVAQDDRPGSPTSVNVAAGGVGRRTRRYSSPMITTQAIAQDVADRLLERHLRFSEETSLTAIGLPYIDADDRVFVSHPNAGLSGSPYLVESVDTPILGAESSLRLTAAHDV